MFVEDIIKNLLENAEYRREQAWILKQYVNGHAIQCFTYAHDTFDGWVDLAPYSELNNGELPTYFGNKMRLKPVKKEGE